MRNQYVDVPEGMCPIDKLVEVKNHFGPTVWLSQKCFDYVWNNASIKPDIAKDAIEHEQIITLEWLPTEKYSATRLDLYVQKSKFYATMYRLEYAEADDIHYRRISTDVLYCTVLKMPDEDLTKK